MKLQFKRVYDQPADTDGIRILVDRLWPRGLTKAEARIDHWAKDVAPSNELRRWFQHDESKWPEFQRKYLDELRINEPAVKALIDTISDKNATLLFSAREKELNNAAVLKQYLETLQ